MKRILVVDDEPDVVDYLVELLDSAGWETGTAFNGVDAVIRTLDEHWDAIVMDIRMPKLDGVNALKIIKHFNPAVPVIMFTGQAGRGDMLETARLGAFTCLLKPVNSEKLLTALSQVLLQPKPAL